MNEQIRDNGNEYIQRTGTIPLTANWDAGAFEIRAETLESDVATGTAPLTIASTTIVTNLNADKIDGQNAVLDIESDHSHQSTGAEGGQLDHGLALTGLTDDDHTQYVLRNILTTRGDLFRRGASVIERVALGTSGYYLKSDGVDAVWATPPGILQVIASDTLLAFADTERSHTGDTNWTKKKEFTVFAEGTLRITFDLKSGGAGDTAYGRIYRNGVAVGTQQTVVGTTYATKSEDIAGWSVDDLVQLYIKVALSGETTYCRNARVYGTIEYLSVDTD